MAKLYYRYGTMGSSKTANALMVHFNYQERGKSALLLKPSIELRDGYRQITSRTGMSAQCQLVEDCISQDGVIIGNKFAKHECVIVDEAQFLTRQQVLALVQVVDVFNIPVICYGLRTDFQGNFFSGSCALMAYADSIEEIKTVCWCGRKATHNARFNETGVVRNGEQILLGGNDRYIGLCRKHFLSGDLGGCQDK